KQPLPKVESIPPMKIQDTVGVITGACSPVGRALAMELAKREAHGLALVDRDPSVKELAAEVNRVSEDWVACGFCGELSDPVFRQAVFAETAERCGSVNVLVPSSPTTEAGCSGEHQNANGITPLNWALEMVGRIGKRRRESGLKGWHPAETLQGMV